MTTSLEEILKLYTGGTVDLDHVRDWLATNQWSLDTEGQALADQVDAALVQLDDRYITETDLRSWLIHAMSQLHNRAERMVAHGE